MSKALIIGSIVICLILFMLNRKHNITYRAQVKLCILTIYMISILIWPLIWEYMLKDHAYTNASLPSLFWPIFIILFELYLLKYHKLENEIRSRKGLLSMDANAICTLTFALSSILSAHSDGNCKNLFIYGVLGCIAFVMPNISAPSETVENIVIETIQKMCLTYSTGLLLAGAILLQTQKNKLEK